MIRIISHLVPNGQPISTDIEGNRQPGENTWAIPTWGRPLALGVYPVFLRKHRSLVPAGTTFCISKLGFGVTSILNIRETAGRCRLETVHRDIGALFTPAETQGRGMAVLHHQAVSGDRFSGNLSNLAFTAVVGQTDICYVLPQFRRGFPYLPLPLSFAMPRIDSRVVCVGYGTHSSPDASFSLDDMESGRINLLDVYERKLLAIEGRVSHIFTQRFTGGFVGGPCFTIDAEISPCMSGGPVFSENGYVCGVLSANASGFFNNPSSIVSLLHPALGMNIRLDGQIGNVRLSSKRRLVDLIQQGVVMTDGSEKNWQTGRKDGEVSPDLAFHNEDADRVYEDFADFQERRSI